MRKYMVLAGLVLAISAPSARSEEYTGHGAIAPSSSSPAGSSGGSSSAPDRAKDWEEKEAQRRAHWHAVVEKGKDFLATHRASITLGSPKDAEAAGEESGALSGDGTAADPDAPRKSRWETFKENHPEQVQNATEQLQELKSNAHDDKQNVMQQAHNWKSEHAQEIGAAKEAAKDAATVAKTKWQEWKEKRAQKKEAAGEE